MPATLQLRLKVTVKLTEDRSQKLLRAKQFMSTSKLRSSGANLSTTSKKMVTRIYNTAKYNDPGTEQVLNQFQSFHQLTEQN